MFVSSFCDDGVACTQGVGASLLGFNNIFYDPSSERRPVLVPCVEGRRVGHDLDLRELWRDIVAGRWFIFDTSLIDERCWTRLRRGQQEPVNPRSAEALRQALLGGAQKVTASDLGVCDSTLSALCHQSLTAICPECRVSRAPMLLAMAARAASGQWLPSARLEARRTDGVELTVSTPWPGASWRDVLSGSEWHVARLALSGCTQREIAALCGTSGRTIANQMASIFRKLNVSGRCALRAAAVLTLSAGAHSSAGRPSSV